MRLFLLSLLVVVTAGAQSPGEEMVAGMARYLDHLTANAPANRRPSAEKLRRMIGAVDPRVPFEQPVLTPRGETARYRIFAARWPVLDGVTARGLYYEPKTAPVRRVVVLSPDLRRARELAATGCAVLAPVLIDTGNAYSGHAALGLKAQMPHREWIYRMAFPVGRHIYGYEVEKALAAVDWFARQGPVAVYGDGDGAAEAVFAAVLDERIREVEVHGFSVESPALWRQPVYRNVFGLLRDFGDAEFARMLGNRAVTLPIAAALADTVEAPDVMGEQVRELVEYTQRLVVSSERDRAALWAQLGPQKVADKFLDEVLGRLPGPKSALNARRTFHMDGGKWRAEAVRFDVRPDVFGFGYLLLPKDLWPGERRPLVVVQHGLAGTPDVFFGQTSGQALEVYRNFGAQLAELGFIVFCPQSPTIGDFRPLVRRANPLGLSLFSLIRAQHESMLDWLVTLPEVDPARIGFYGLSYGGKTALRVPPFDARFRVAVCGGDFNAWIRKLTTTEERYSYLYSPEYEVPEWDMAHIASHAELAMLMAPRAFLVERGHRDGVGKDEWVAYEYAKVRRYYDEAGLGDRTAIAYFNGPHRVDGPAAIAFLRKFLAW